MRHKNALGPAGYFKIIPGILFWVLTLPFFAHATCEPDLTGLAQSPTFEQLFKQIFEAQARQSKNGIVYILISEDTLKKFWRETWPEITRLAGEQDTSVEALVVEYWSMIDLIAEEMDLNKQQVAHIRALSASVPQACRELSEIAPGSKMKPRNWSNVKVLYDALISLGHLAFYLESNWRERPSFNPLDPISAQVVRRIFESIEKSGLEQAALLAQTIRGQTTPVLADVGGEESPAGEEVPPSLRNVGPSDHDFGAQVLEPADRPGISTGESRLALVLSHNIPLRADFPYEAVTLFGRKLMVTLSPKLVGEYQRGEAAVIQRLLRGILTGRGDKLGIKTLFEIGPGIVELKAIMNGHKRIFGCLDGTRLVLKTLINIKDDGGTYSRRIPHDFCADMAFK